MEEGEVMAYKSPEQLLTEILAEVRKLTKGKKK
jgi:hypothetical protein